MKYIPNFITSLNLAAGFIAIIFAANGDVVTASWLILAAMIFDFLDGFSARLLKAYSEMGKELDSLADVVSFGVAPGFIIYKLISDSLSLYMPAIINSDGLKATLLMIIPVLMPVCAALRLAIFNLDTTQATTFKGLPTPANALAVISVVLAGHYSQSTIFSSFTGSPVLLIIFTVLLSLMMVSRIPLISLKFSNLKLKGNEGRFILVGLVMVTFAIFRIEAAPLIIPLYIIASFLSLLFRPMISV
jgi:CDP-diacylglycerol---serine O-phosphatidyltransferase